MQLLFIVNGLSLCVKLLFQCGEWDKVTIYCTDLGCVVKANVINVLDYHYSITVQVTFPHGGVGRSLEASPPGNSTSAGPR